MVDQIQSEAGDLALTRGHSSSFGADVIVAGATGLIGQYVIETISAMNRLSGNDTTIWAVSSQPGTSFSEASCIRPVAIDLRNPCVRLDDLPNRASCLIFAAGYGQPGKFMGSPLDPLAVNVTGLRALIDRLDEGARVLYISSSELYSGLDGAPFEESQIGTTNPGHPRAPYIEAKRAGEALVLAASRSGRIQASVARLALAYGPGTRADDTRVLNEFIRGAITEGQVRMRDAGESMRTYCYVKDAVDMMLWLIAEDKDGVFNVGGESRVSIRDLAELITSMCGVDLQVPQARGSGSPGAPDDVWLSLQKIREAGYNGRLTPLPEGLRNTIEWQRQHLYPNEVTA